jgi:hypothetical protein
VVDAPVGLPQLLALLERHVSAVTLPPGARDDARWPRQVILWPRRRRKLAQERRRWWGRRPVAEVHGRARDRLGVVLGLLKPRMHFHGAGCVDCGCVCVTDGHAHKLKKAWPATARAGPRAFAINTGAEAQVSSRQSAASV